MIDPLPRGFQSRKALYFQAGSHRNGDGQAADPKGARQRPAAITFCGAPTNVPRTGDFGPYREPEVKPQDKADSGRFQQREWKNAVEEQNSETGTKLWSVIISIQKHAQGTRANARLYWPGIPLEGTGQTPAELADEAPAKVSDGLAAAHALSDLASQLFAATVSAAVPAEPPVATKR